jgi:hypothetical protein
VHHQQQSPLPTPARKSSILTNAPAIAFTYFEALLRVGDANKFGDEEARLNSMGNLLDHIGYPRDIWIDFADGAFDLMRKLADSVQAMDGAAADILLQTFNDMNESMSIITYVKVRSMHPSPAAIPPNLSSFLPVPGCKRTQTTSGTLSPWGTSRRTVQTTLNPPSVKLTTSALPPSPMHWSSLLASASRSGIWTVPLAKKSTAASTPNQQITTSCLSLTRTCSDFSTDRE